MEHRSTDINSQYCNPEIWGGVECTINRVQDIFRDQLIYSGHYSRPGDIERFAELGIKKIRYPLLWEFHQPVTNKPIDWSWTEKQLKEIRKKHIKPVAGLLHHGSGPAFTDLTDHEFPDKLALYAKAVAKRFPWIEYYTPVNEPLTTARFSGLYGLWYPHGKDELTFFKMLINQLKGIVLSMQAIRKINPKAKLVQTEDLSKTHSTVLLSYQADFENERRWLTYDFLCGKVDQQHFFWNYFISMGIDTRDLEFFIENRCPPDIVGFNYYVTSERYLDEKIENYHCSTHGGNYKHKYADVEAVRVKELSGLNILLKEAWERYNIPIAITENHLSCTREEQMRWFKETWEDCCNLRTQGVDVIAVTVWSLLGAFDWNSLLTCTNNYYESGAFDIGNNQIRKTALGKMVKAIATTGEYHHPLLNIKGWWNKNRDMNQIMNSKKENRLLIIGKNGTLGNAFMKICEHRSIPYIALGRKDMDISNEREVRAIIDEYRPWGLINTAGYVKVDDAETNYNECFSVNTIAPGILANTCNIRGIHFMTFSSDLIFDGAKKMPYHENDLAKPLSIYGISKSNAERVVQKVNPGSLIIRTSAFFGPWDKYNFVYTILNSLENERTYSVVKDVIVSPTYVPDLANTAMDLFIDEEKGIWHLSNEGMVSWADFACDIADRAGYKKNNLLYKNLDEMGWKAQRPLYSALKSAKGIKLPALDNALERFFEHRTV
ncbi:MAG TPA: family 1 glycosylhydrolase [Chitinophagaceae bacterium]|nr:family 1 glycosylhydrolase [Chitinophagaceae bacterium]